MWLATTVAERWALAVGAAPIAARGLRLDALGGLRAHERPRAEVSRWLEAAGAPRPLFDAYVARALDGWAATLGDAVAVAGWAAHAGWIPAPRAWALAFDAAVRARTRFSSWPAFAEASAAERAAISDGRDAPSPAAAALLVDPCSPWTTLPWDVPVEALRPPGPP